MERRLRMKYPNDKSQISNAKLIFPSVLLNHSQDIAAINRGAHRHVNRNYSTALRRFHLILHLHCFYHYHAAPNFDLLAHFNQQPHDFARHRRHDAGGAITVRA